jgi:hypothetical protein
LQARAKQDCSRTNNDALNNSRHAAFHSGRSPDTRLYKTRSGDVHLKYIGLLAGIVQIQPAEIYR